MNYLVKNNVKYINRPNVIIYSYAGAASTDYGTLSYSNNKFNSTVTSYGATYYYDTISTDTLIATKTLNVIDTTFVYAVCLPIQCSNFTEITSNDTITFTVSVGDQSFVKSFQLLPQCINFFNLFDMITITSPVKLFTITASVVSNAQLQLFKYTDSHSLMFAIVAL